MGGRFFGITPAPETNDRTSKGMGGGPSLSWTFIRYITLCPLGVSLQKFASRAFFGGTRTNLDSSIFGIAAASLFSCSLLRGHKWKHTRKTGANTRKTSANTRKTSANPKYVTISILQETRAHEASIFWGTSTFWIIGQK